jgi:hypothetical protein
MVPDYTWQLNQIVQALNRPAMPTWLIAVLSASLGVFGGMMGKFFETWLQGVNQRRAMRRVLYKDIAYSFGPMSVIMAPREYEVHDAYTWRREQLKAQIRFTGEDYIASHREVFFQLDEHPAFTQLYLSLHQVLDSPKEMHVNAGRSMWLLGRYLYNNELRAPEFLKHLGDTPGSEFVRSFIDQYKESLEKVRQMEEDGNV